MEEEETGGGTRRSCQHGDDWVREGHGKMREEEEETDREGRRRRR